LIDGNGGEPLDDSLIVIEGNTIQNVSQVGKTTIPERAYVIDAQGKTILPGLHDMHVHLSTEPSPSLFPKILEEETGAEYQKHLYALLFCGVTSILDLHDPDEDFFFGLRKKEREHCLVSPHIFTVGSGITYQRGYPGGFFFWPLTQRSVSSPEEARKEIQDLAQKGPDAVKIFYEDRLGGVDWPILDLPTLEALIDESKLQGLKTTVHVLHTDLAKDVVRLQPDSIAHLPPVDY